MPPVMAAPSTRPLPASADPTAPPVIESPEGARVTIGGRQYDWFRGNSYLGLQANPDVLRAACEATLRYGLKLRSRLDFASIADACSMRRALPSSTCRGDMPTCRLAAASSSRSRRSTTRNRSSVWWTPSAAPDIADAA